MQIFDEKKDTCVWDETHEVDAPDDVNQIKGFGRCPVVLAPAKGQCVCVCVCGQNTNT